MSKDESAAKLQVQLKLQQLWLLDKENDRLSAEQSAVQAKRTANHAALSALKEQILNLRVSKYAHLLVKVEDGTKVARLNGNDITFHDLEQ